MRLLQVPSAAWWAAEVAPPSAIALIQEMLIAMSTRLVRTRCSATTVYLGASARRYMLHAWALRRRLQKHRVRRHSRHSTVELAGAVWLQMSVLGCDVDITEIPLDIGVQHHLRGTTGPKQTRGAVTHQPCDLTEPCSALHTIK